MHSLFTGPNSLRDRWERVAFWLTAICALPAALAIGFVLHESIGASQVALFIAIAMVYVTLARGRLLGSSVRIHENQYPRLFRIVKDACAALEIPMPLVFVREETSGIPVAALGFGEPYALVLSSHFIEYFQDDELRFAIGCELGHIAAGHTRFLSLLSVNGNENPLISLIFGAWLRRCTTSCDKIGLLCCGSLDAAIRAMGVATFLDFGRKIDLHAFAEQHAEMEADNISRWGQWLGADPYATSRIAALRAFMETPQYTIAAEWFNRERGEEPPALAQPGTTTVTDKDCAGWWRRLAAYAIDAVVCAAIVGSFFPVQIGASSQQTPAAPEAPPRVHANGRHGATPAPSATEEIVQLPGITIKAPIHRRHAEPPASDASNSGDEDSSNSADSANSGDDESSNLTDDEQDMIADSGTIQIGPFMLDKDGWHLGHLTFRNDLFDPTSKTGFSFWLVIYMAVLVTVAGQTFGMMITGLRVVTIDFQRVPLWKVACRYAIVMCLYPVIIVMSFFWRRVLLHDKWTKTRLVKVERVIARATGTN